MTLTPNQTPGKSHKRSPGTAAGESAEGPQETGTAVGEPAAAEDESLSVPEPTSFREQLEAAGMDLSGNPLAEKLDSIAAVPVTPMESDDDDSDRHGTEGAHADEQVAPVDSGTQSDGGGIDRSPTADEGESTSVVTHPLLSDAEWCDLDRLAPRVDPQHR